MIRTWCGPAIGSACVKSEVTDAEHGRARPGCAHGKLESDNERPFRSAQTKKRRHRNYNNDNAYDVEDIVHWLVLQ